MYPFHACAQCYFEVCFNTHYFFHLYLGSPRASNTGVYRTVLQRIVSYFFA